MSIRTKDADQSRARVGINGFGRIGRTVFRASLLRDDIRVAAINHTCSSVHDVIHQICYDSTHGPLHKGLGFQNLDIRAIDENTLSVQGHKVHLFSEREPSRLNWNIFGVEYVIECTGKFTTSAASMAHIKYGGVRKVLISAPSKDSATFVFGVNANEYAISKPDIISCASCTTNCLAPITKVLNDKFGITQALMTTVHASTRSQYVLDSYSKRDRRAGRSVLGNVIPTSTGAAKAISTVLPELSGKLTGISLRVPMYKYSISKSYCKADIFDRGNVSLVDLTVHLDKATSLDQIIQAFQESSQGYMEHIMHVENDELVSCDFQGSSYSAVIDAKACVELNPRVKHNLFFNTIEAGVLFADI